MNEVIIATLIIVALGGAGAVLVRDPARQVIALSFQGFALALLFVALQAPEVALSQLAVGAVLVPLMYVTAIARTRKRPR